MLLLNILIAIGKFEMYIIASRLNWTAGFDLESLKVAGPVGRALAANVAALNLAAIGRDATSQ